MKNTPGDSLRAVPDRGPDAAELAERKARELLDQAGGMLAAQMIAAAQVHATLAVAGRVAELTAAVESIGVTGAALTAVQA